MGSIFTRGGRSASLLCAAITALALPALANPETVLHRFQGSQKDGRRPYGGLTTDGAGNFFGMTTWGGKGPCVGGGCGIIFKITAAGDETVLHDFCSRRNCSDGAWPYANLIMDNAGKLFGTTSEGGGVSNAGTVFELGSDGKETTLYSFAGGSDGSLPEGTLVEDSAGNFFGTTLEGGGTGCHDGQGCGTVFKIAPNGSETILHAFDGDDGYYPTGNLVEDAAGNLYGTTEYGGAYSGGVAFKVTPDGTDTVLYSFGGSEGDGSLPKAGVIMDQAGNLFGTTYDGGKRGCRNEHGCGTLFEVTPQGVESTLYEFAGRNDGSHPNGGLVEDGAGNLYGTTTEDGIAKCGPGRTGCGSIFEFTQQRVFTVLYEFGETRRRNPEDGANPYGSLVMDGRGNLYGTTLGGGSRNCVPYGCGVVFMVQPQQGGRIAH